MKLATLKDSTRDGRLVVVSKDLTRCSEVGHIARTLQADGWRSAHSKDFTENSVRALLARMGVVSTSPKRPSAVVTRRAGEFTVSEIAVRLNLPEGTVYNWLYKARLPARRVEAAWHRLWLVRLEDAEALLRQRAGAARLPPRPAA